MEPGVIHITFCYPLGNVISFWCLHLQERLHCRGSTRLPHQRAALAFRPWCALALRYSSTVSLILALTPAPAGVFPYPCSWYPLLTCSVLQRSCCLPGVTVSPRWGCCFLNTEPLEWGHRILSPIPNANRVFPLLGKLGGKRLQLLSEVCPLIGAVRDPNEGFCYMGQSFSRMKHCFQRPWLIFLLFLLFWTKLAQCLSEMEIH